MTQQIIYSGNHILQWQDTEKLNYAASPDGVQTLVVTPEQWTKQDVLKWVVNGVLTEVEPPAPPPPAANPITKFSTLDYFSRFTDTEYAAARSGPMAIQRGLDMLIAAQYVDVTDSRVAEYLSAMVTAGIITEARKTELLAPGT